MLTALLKALLREYRTHRMARFTVWVLAYGAALWSVDQLAGGAPTALWVLFWIAAVVCGVYYLGRLLAFTRHRLLWRLRRRLIVTYVFIAIVPIVLILVLAGLGAFILNGQFAAYLVASNLREHFDELQQVNRVVAHEAPLAGPRTTKEKLDWIEKFYSTELEHHAISYPSLEITLRMGSEVRAFRLDGTRISTPITLPAWFKQEEFSGIVVDDGRLALRSIERRNAGGEDWTFILSEAFTPELLDMVGEGVGPVGVEVTPPTLKATPAGTPTPGAKLQIETPQESYESSASVTSRRISLPKPASRFDFTVSGRSVLDAIDWKGERQRQAAVPVMVFVSSSVMALNRRLLETLGRIFPGLCHRVQGHRRNPSHYRRHRAFYRRALDALHHAPWTSFMTLRSR